MRRELPDVRSDSEPHRFADARPDAAKVLHLPAHAAAHAAADVHAHDAAHGRARVPAHIRADADADDDADDADDATPRAPSCARLRPAGPAAVDTFRAFAATCGRTTGAAKAAATRFGVDADYLADVGADLLALADSYSGES